MKIYLSYTLKIWYDLCVNSKKIKVSNIELKEVIHLLDNKIVTVDEATKRLNLNSSRTLYRRIKEYKEMLKNIDNEKDW